MFGVMKIRENWQWFVWGKHPGIEDFISAGTPTPLFQKFTKWVDSGFAGVLNDDVLRTRFHSWRFWTAGTGNKIVCGLIRNSCDSYGRSFPLLCLAMGNLKDWTLNCSLLPFALEPIWKNFEYHGSARYNSLKRLSEAMQLMQAPITQWETLRKRIYIESNLASAADFVEETGSRKRLFRIDCSTPEKLPLDVNFCHWVAPQAEKSVPNAVFIGEIGKQMAVAVVDNTITPEDFIWLWSFKDNMKMNNK